MNDAALSHVEAGRSRMAPASDVGPGSQVEAYDNPAGVTAAEFNPATGTCLRPALAAWQRAANRATAQPEPIDPSSLCTPNDALGRCRADQGGSMHERNGT